MRTISICAVWLTFFATSVALAATWDIDSSHSSANFRVKHMMVTNVSGQITGITGKVDLNDSDMTKSKVTASLKASTINTNDAKRDKHLRSADFLDTSKHPSIKFVSTGVKRSKKGNLDVMGKLTMRGVTKPVTLTVEGPTKAIKDPWGKVRRGLSATTMINRKDFGVVWNKTLDGGGFVVGDEIQIILDLELTRPSKSSE